MPRRKMKGKSRKRVYRKTKRYTGRAVPGTKGSALINQPIVNLGLGFPKKIMVTHKFHETYSLPATSGAIGTVNWCANAMTEPRIGQAHQPMYFDQLGALYSQYCVVGSKATIKLVPFNASQPVMKFACYVNDDPTLTPTTIDTMGEQSNGSQRLLAFGQNGQAVKVCSYSARKWFGKGVLNDNVLSGTTASNPSELVMYSLAVQAADASSTATVYVEIDIEYIAIWTELKDIAGS